MRIRYFDVEIGWFFGRLCFEFWFISFVFDSYNKIFIIYLSRNFLATILTALYYVFNIYILIRDFKQEENKKIEKNKRVIIEVAIVVWNKVEGLYSRNSVIVSII